MERADEVAPLALDWLRRNAQTDNWFLHVNFWDPHAPYRTPFEVGNPFAEESIPAWLTEEVRQRALHDTGMRCAQELHGWGGERDYEQYPRVPEALDSMDAVRQFIDGYDVGVRYADHYVGQILAALADAGVLDQTVIMISADHGENLGELGVWGDHQTADHMTCRVPLIVRGPGIAAGRVDDALHYHFDWAATLIELAGGTVPANWDGKPFTPSFRAGTDSGRNYLVLSQGCHVCQRAVRFDYEGDTYVGIRTYHDGYKLYDDVMLFDLTDDPHEQHNLADIQQDVVRAAMAYLVEWQHTMICTSEHQVDPLMTVLREGGPYHARVDLPEYLIRLRATGRVAQADKLAVKYETRLP
jgi:choline-sulfatase